MKVAILDDYQNVALRLADWSGVRRHARVYASCQDALEPALRLRSRRVNVQRRRPAGWANFAGAVDARRPMNLTKCALLNAICLIRKT